MSLHIGLRYTLYSSILCVAALVLTAVSGCATRSTPVAANNPETIQPEGSLPFNMPQIPTGADDVRQSNVVDSDSVVGSGFIDSFGDTVDGSAATFEGGTTPADIMAFGLYQHAARPAPAEPTMVTVIGYYQDVDPVDIDPSEGYYVLVADYASNSWITTGFYKTTTTRVMIPESANVVSPAGFIYTAVVAYNGNAVRVTRVQIGYDAGPGYEQYVLPEVPGMSVGRMCDIELDTAGVPQIAYLTSASLLEEKDTTIRVARLVADEWDIQSITTIDAPKYVDIALGSNGRRAIVTINNSQMYILVDTGTGDFSVLHSTEPGGGIPTVIIDDIRPAITFVNGMNNPAGELDTALILYAVDGGGGEMEMRFVETDGVVPLVEGSVIAAPTPRVDYIGLTTGSNLMATAVVLDDGLVETDCMFYDYSATTDSWGAVMANWEGQPLGSADRNGVMLREISNGNIVAAYRSEDDAKYVFGVTDGLTWTSNENDAVSCSVSPAERAIDFEANSNEEVIFPTVYGNYSPMFYFGEIGNLAPFDQLYLGIQQLSCSDISLAIDSANTFHFAWQHPMDGTLIYATFDAAEQMTSEIVDNGSDGVTYGTGPAPIVADGNTLHVFHLDQAHGQIVYSRNVAGIWEAEQAPVLPILGLPYTLINAGLLEETGEIYVGFIDYLDSYWKLLISDANQETWRVVNVTPAIDLPFDPVVVFSDDESSISALYYQLNLITDDVVLHFDHSVSDQANRSLEFVSTNEGFIHDTICLTYNQFNDEWYAATNDDSEQHAYLFHRVTTGTWMGPFTIDQQTTGASAKLTVEGLGCRTVDGEVSAIVSERDHGATIRQFSILTFSPTDIAFRTKTLISSFDESLFDGDWRVYTTGNPDGELALLVIRHLLADPTLDALMFTEDAGVWSFELWDSPITRQLSWLPCGFAIMENGQPAVTFVESDRGEPLYGRVTMYYPW